jgi:hypothetical protein
MLQTMTAVSLDTRGAALTRRIYLDVPRAAVYAYIFGLSAAYVFVYAHTPLALFFWPHDDGLFVKLGQYLAEGKWLGPFDQFTLMKGPGYPLFLALANWLGVSVSLAHAVFHCVATGFFVAVCQRFIKSYLISAFHFALLLWHPLLLSVILLRIIRDAIYTDQVLVFLGFLILLLFCAPDIKRRVMFAIASGLALGWLWLTREEGVWLLPGIAVLSAGALVRDVRVGRLRAFAASLVIFVATFGATQIAFLTANRIAYGKFIGVDFKEANFRRALSAIHSVVSGGTRHYVSVTRSAREQIYRVSPAFATLSRYLDVPPDQGWAATGCAVIPSTCGEIASGWFMWALRGAVEASGHYASPGRASAFFGLIADEITTACARGELRCEPQLVAEMPHVTWSDFANLPSLYAESLNYLLLLNPPLQLGTSSGGHDIFFQSAMKFLNHPPYGKREGETQHSDHYEINGWYLTSGSDWFTTSVKDPAGLSGEVKLERRASPEFAKNSPDATQQRFVLNIHCSDDCILRVEATNGAAIEKHLGDFRGRSMSALPVGKGTFYVESVEVQPDPYGSPHLTDKVALSIREFVLKNYKFVFMPVLAVGVAGFLGSLLFWRKIATNGCFIIALTCWTLVFIRLSMLVLITATSMFSFHGIYHGPACSLLVSASIISIAAFLQLAGYAAPRGAAKA